MIVQLLLRDPVMYPRLTRNVCAATFGPITETPTGYAVTERGLEAHRVHRIPFANVLEVIEEDPPVPTPAVPTPAVPPRPVTTRKK